MNKTASFVHFLVFACLLTGVPASERAGEGSDSPSKVRGVWMHPGIFGKDSTAALEKMAAILDGYAAAGINTLFILVKNTSGHLYFASEIGVRDPAWRWDFFGAFLEQARRRKMEVHPWFCVFTESALLGPVRQHPEWLITSPKREMLAVANPALPAVRAYEISLMAELVSKYGVKWIHLDYLRFPCEPAEPWFSFDPESLRRFREETGLEMSEIKARDTGNIAWNLWLRWNTEQVTLFVRELKTALRESGREIGISAAVFPDAVNARVMIGQDWALWAREGLVQMLNPMLYTNRSDLYEKLLREAMAVDPGHTLVCPGIGIGTSHNQSTPDIMSEQMRISMALGADGVVFFSASSLTELFLARLREEK